MASLSFSPRYASPEMVMAYEARQAQVPAEAAVDMWAIGIIAYEVRCYWHAVCHHVQCATSVRDSPLCSEMSFRLCPELCERNLAERSANSCRLAGPFPRVVQSRLHSNALVVSMHRVMALAVSAFVRWP